LRLLEMATAAPPWALLVARRAREGLPAETGADPDRQTPRWWAGAGHDL